MIGQFIDGYQITQSLGRGRSAEVHVARQHPVERYVALKVFDATTSAEALKRLGALLATFDHTHVLPVYASGEANGCGYWVMRYMPAGSLETKLRAHRLTSDEIDRLMAQVAPALDYVEQHGLAHGNLKPSNILLDHSGNAFISDIGLTPQPSDYQAPELKGAKTPDSRSDVYSLAAIVVEVITGHAPIDQHFPANTSGSKISPALESVLTKALVFDPAQRYATPLEFAAAFTQAHTSKAAATAPIATGEAAIEVRRIRPRRAGGSWGWLVGGVIGLAIVAGLIAMLSSRTPTAAPIASPTSIVTLAPSRTTAATVAVINATPTQTQPPASPATTVPTQLPTATTASAVAITPTISATATRTLAPTPRRLRPTATPTLTIEAFTLLVPRTDTPELLSLSFRTYVRPDNISPVGTLSMSVPAVEPFVISHDLADVGAGEQVLRVGVRVDCTKVVGPLTSDRVVITLRTKAGAVLATQSFEYIKRWCE